MQTLSRTALLSALVAGTLALAGCQNLSTPTVRFDRQVNYGDAKAVELVTNEFGSSDLQMIAEKMTGSLLETGIFQGRPTVTISTVKNKTSEYFDTRQITDTILAQLQKNGIKYTIENEDMQNQVDELRRQNQSGLYKKSKAAKMGNMDGAKYRLDGSISSIIKKSSSVKDVYYKMNLRLIEIESGIVEWSDEKDIRKSAKR